MKNNILVIGGTGKTGRRVVKGLKAQGQNVRIGTREAEIPFDWEKPETYAPALNGMDMAYIVYYPDLAVPGAKEAIKALSETALKAGLEKVVLLSGKGEEEAERCEEIIAYSGLNYTLVRASWFAQNFSEAFLRDPILAGTIAMPMPEAKIPYVDADDIAEVVVKVLLDPAYNSQTIEVTGPERLTFAEVAAAISQGIGRPINYQPISMEAFAGGMKAAGLPDDYIWLFSYLFREVLGRDELQTVSHDVERVLGRKATSFKEFVAKTVPTGAWNVPVDVL